VEGKVAGVVKGGFEVSVAGQRAFCPFSQIDVRRVDDQASYLNQVFSFRLIEVSEDGRRIVVSRRKILEAEAARAAVETRKLLVEGAVLSGRVTSVTAFGAFVDVGGVQGLVHVSEVTHRRIENAAEVLQPGQAVTVQVLKYDPAKGKLALSMRALEGDPWAAVAGALRARQVVRGRLARVVEFGAFVELLPGVDGLLHVTELPRGSLQALKEAAKAREEISVLILEIDLAKRRISLAAAPEGLAPGAEAPSTELSVGSLVTGKVEAVMPFGVMLRIAPGQTGVIPNNEMATPRGTDHAKEFPPGTELSAEVVSIEAGGRKIRLSRARAEKREERAELERHGKPELTGGLSTLGDLLKQAQQKRKR
jgi:small subunit ribosomal protein S1